MTGRAADVRWRGEFGEESAGDERALATLLLKPCFTDAWPRIWDGLM
jgi:hypothetical protein